MKVVHKPTVVDAVIWDGSAEALAEIDALGLQWSWNEYGDLLIHTLQGPRAGAIGDVVMRGTVGEGYWNTPDVFAACYEVLQSEVGPITVTTGGAP